MSHLDLPIRRIALSLLTIPLFVAGCAADVAPEESHGEAIGETREGWDSQAGNPTHATHSYLTEYAVDNLSPYFPELATYKTTIVDGANQELHEIAISDPELEALRVAAGGTNWSCNHPEVVWNKARAFYAAGDKTRAYRYVGIVLHWVEDMGVPAHAFHVIHQGTLSQKDNFELLGLQRWSPKFDINQAYPGFRAPSDYMTWNGSWAASDFRTTFPGVTYTTTYFPMTWLFISTKQSDFVREREGRTATAAYWALYAAVTNF